MSKQLPTLTLTEGPRPVSGSPLVRGATLGRYVVLDLLGSGGMGVVYAAYDFGLDRRVCLKLVQDRGSTRTAERQERLLREARAAARVSHPNVVTVHDVGTWEDHVFVAMELVEGGTLRKWLRAQDRSLAELLEVFTQAGRGLAAAHAAGLVHRDFKPDNVLVGTDGRVRVTDFGLARDVDAVIAGDGGNTSGTPAYMAPEQHRGEAATAATDQFSFALALYEALYLRSPYDATTGEELRAAKVLGKFSPAPARSKVPGWLRAAVMQGLSPDRSQRHASMDELLASLRPPRRHRTFAAVGAATTAFAAAGVALVFAQAPAPVQSSASTRVTVLADATPAPQCAQPPVTPDARPDATSFVDAVTAPRQTAATRRAEAFDDRVAFGAARPVAIPAPTAGPVLAPIASSTARRVAAFTVHVPDDAPGETDRETWLTLVGKLERALTELGLLEAAPEVQLLASAGMVPAQDRSRAAYLLGQFGEVLAGQVTPRQVNHPVLFPTPQDQSGAEIARLEAELASASTPVEAAKVQFALARLLYTSDSSRAVRLAREAQETLRRHDLADARALLVDVEDWLDDHGTRIRRSQGL